MPRRRRRLVRASVILNQPRTGILTPRGQDPLGSAWQRLSVRCLRITALERVLDTPSFSRLSQLIATLPIGRLPRLQPLRLVPSALALGAAGKLWPCCRLRLSKGLCSATPNAPY